MPILFGSGQAAGGMLLDLTAVDQVLHTAVAGGGTPELISLFAINKGASAEQVTITVANAGATEEDEFVETVGLQTGLQPLFNGNQIALNAASTISVRAAAGSQVAVVATVDDQTGVNTRAQQLLTGEITLVQNTDAFRMNGVASSATEADHQLLIPLAGYLTNLRARAVSAIGGGATATVVVRVNGADTGLTFTIDNADGTTLLADTDQVTVAAGDLVTINAATDNAGAPAATVQGSVEYVPS